MRDPCMELQHAPMGRLQVGIVVLCIALNGIDGFDVLAISFAAPSIAAVLATASKGSGWRPAWPEVSPARAGSAQCAVRHAPRASASVFCLFIEYPFP